jgi:uncharacterized protein YjdB
MKKFYRQLLAFVLVAAMVMATGGGMTVEAADTEVQTYDLVANDTWISGSIQETGGVNLYQITITEAGYLTVAYQAWSLARSYCYILNADMTDTYDSKSAWNATEINPQTTSISNWMEAGTYIVKIDGVNDDIGTYKLKASFKAAQNNETEPNNDFATAMELSAKQTVKGLLSRDDATDFYKFTLNASKTVKFTYLAYIDMSCFELWDDDFQKIRSDSVWNGSEDSPQTYTYETTLAAGTYYIKISPYYSSSSSDRGRYSLRYQVVQKVTSIKISGNKKVVAGKSFQLKATVSPSSATDKTVSWSSDNSSVASVDANTGKVTARGAGTAHITAKANDSGSVSKSVTVVVLPKKVSSLSARKSSAFKKALYVGWGYQSGVSGYQVSYSTNKNFKNAKTKTVTSTGVNIIGLKQNTKYYVRVRAYVNNGSKKQYGAWSSVKSGKAS